MSQRPANAPLTIPLVEAAIAWARENGQRIEVRDLSAPGLHLRVGAGPSGRATWVFRFGAGGQRITLGRFPGLTLKAARDVAALQRRKVAEGTNPVTLRREAREAMTVAQLAVKFKAEHTPTLKPRTKKQYERLIDKKIVPKLGSVKVRTLDRPEVARWHQALPNGVVGRRDANFALSVLSVMLTKAELWGERPEGTNPAKRIPRFDENMRQRYLKPEELAKLSAALEKEHGTAANGIRILILTGMRLGELLTLTWDMIDWESRTVTFGSDQHKTGRKKGAKTLPLSPPTMDLLQSMPRGLRSGQVVLIDEGRMERYWAAIRSTVGLDDVHIHDLRHTFGSYGAARGVSLKILGGLLGQSNAATTNRYAHLDVDPLRIATDAIGAALDAAMKKAPEGA